MKHPAWPLLGAAGCITAGGVAFSAAEHVPVTTGLYWALATATTVGYGDVTPHHTAGRIIAAVVMLTAIPLLAAAWAWLAARHAAARVRQHIGEDAAAARRIAADLHKNLTGTDHPDAPGGTPP